MINVTLWIPNADFPWRDLPECYGPCQTAYKNSGFDAILDGCKSVSTKKTVSTRVDSYVHGGVR